MTDAAGDDAAAHIDLHLHSTASDGTNPPEVVVQAAHAAGLAALALTDHDTVDGIPAAAAEAQRLGIRLVPGVELSAYENDTEVHLLGLHLTRLDEMQRQLAVFRVARRDRAEEMVRRLNAIGVRITFDDVLGEAAGAAIGRPHVARALVQNGWARDLRDAFDRYLGAGRPAYLEKRRIQIQEAIALVHDCGGIAVLAHPGGEGTQARLAPLVAQGLDGVEVLHPSHGAEDRARLATLGAHFGLVPSGGSDAHGGTDASRVVGAMRVPASWLERQDERAAHTRARARVA
ncbi:MAG TPA: PHP domain-containing protein [Gemmatimonadaceae bacterium]|nr:PHP domain-containing protein [Gemmatimonadaceae bacterium]